MKERKKFMTLDGKGPWTVGRPVGDSSYYLYLFHTFIL